MNRHKILIVDDEENVLVSLKRIFRKENYEIYTANSGFQGIELLEKHDFSLILSDFKMPELNGIEFLKLASEKSPDTIRIILTGYADVDVVISAINEGNIYKFIEKPWKKEDLKIQINKAIEHYGLLNERKELLEKIKRQNEELKEWNINLEEKVEEKTAQLKKAYKELEGRDKILHFLLTVNDFEETLNFILEVILDIVRFDKIVIYMADRERKLMLPKAGYLMKNSKKIKLENEVTNFPTLPVPKLDKDFKSSSVDEYQVCKINEYSYFIPIEKENICLGLILIDNSKTKKTVEKDDLKIIDGYSALAALAINDYFLTSNIPDFQQKVNDILGEFK